MELGNELIKEKTRIPQTEEGKKDGSGVGSDRDRWGRARASQEKKEERKKELEKCQSSASI